MHLEHCDNLVARLSGIARVVATATHAKVWRRALESLSENRRKIRAMYIANSTHFNILRKQSRFSVMRRGTVKAVDGTRATSNFPGAIYCPAPR